MAAGDVVSGISASVANNGFYDIQPSAGVEESVHNCYAGASIELYYFDGSTSVGPFDSHTVGIVNQRFHCTNSRRVRIKNVSGAAQNLGFDGMQTK